MHDERLLILEEEVLLVRHSGEIPEVALHASLYYLQEDEEGPQLLLSAEEEQLLEQAAAERYEEIIRRDLDLANRDLRLFRGIRRAEENWRRYVRFCEKSRIDADPLRQEVGQALCAYLKQEHDEVARGQRSPSVNCPQETVRALAAALQLRPEALPAGWECLCAEK
ncbi:MAG: hypothetical protein HQQ73_03000 [Desulfobulbaceae bacterium]|jgi:hypothetical protein|nr:hypothetical protein [Desulfobulbaceae bacterium]